MGTLWGAATENRFKRAASIRVDIPVICIGNLTAGGTGKTPFSLLVAELAGELGLEPAFLTRGYGGVLPGPHWVAPDRDSAQDVGDEPLLLARKAPTVISRDRAAGARAITTATAGNGAIIMDDGLQNGSLAKDLVIAVVDGRRGIGNGLVIPAGPLRARLAFQLPLVDAIVVNVPEGADPDALPVFSWLENTFNGTVLTATTRPAGDTSWMAGTPIMAFSGIGAPERFFDLARRLGGRLDVPRVFPDHHVFDDADARSLLDEARRRGATLCTTEKDRVRLGNTGSQAELKTLTRVLEIRMDFAEADRMRLLALIERSIRGRFAVHASRDRPAPM
jgi:tetraacyldisaccharide 4'-kinase